MSVSQRPRRKPCALGSLFIPFSAKLGSHQAAPHSVGPSVLTVVCMESNPCCVLFSALFLVMSMADPTAWVSFISWWVLRLLTLGLVTAPAVSTEHRCYLDIPFPCVDSMFGSHGHLLLSWPGRCQTFPWQLHYVHSSLQCLLCSAHVFCFICQCPVHPTAVWPALPYLFSCGLLVTFIPQVLCSVDRLCLVELPSSDVRSVRSMTCRYFLPPA